MTYEQILNNVAQELELPIDVVRNTYRAYWKYIRDSIQSLPLKEDLSDEEFNRLSTNYNIPSLGKLSCTIDKYKGVKKKFQYIKSLREKYAKH